MYDVNGNTIYVQKSQVGAYKKVGWYETYEEAYNAKNAAINNAAASKFKIGMSVRNQTFLYTAYGTVKDINGGKIQVSSNYPYNKSVELNHCNGCKSAASTQVVSPTLIPDTMLIPTSVPQSATLPLES